MMPRSLRARVTIVGVITLALVLGIGAWVTAAALAAALRSDINAQNVEVLDRLAAEIADGSDVRSLLVPVGADGTEFLIFDDDDNLLNASLGPGLGGDTAVVVFETEDGFVQYESGPLLTFEDSEEFPGESDDFLGAPPPPADAIIITSDQWFETSRTVETSDGTELTIVALSPFGVVDRSIDRLTVTLLVTVPVLVALGGLALWLATGASLRPVRRITSEANRIAPSTSGDRLPVPGTGDEIAELTETLNGMLDRLDDGLTRQRQFISDASHELRSPLTTIKGAAELLAGNDELPGGVRPSVSLVQRGATRLEAVLDDVTRLAVGDADFKPVEVDLGDLLQDEATQARAANPGLLVDDSGVDPLVIEAEPVRLSRAVQNLLANAARHADNRVGLSTVVVANTVEILVDDDGPGVAEQDRQRVFERFVRLDDGRSRDEGGSGLGLAIVASVAASHRGTVRCEDGPSGGARFVLRLPVRYSSTGVSGSR